MRRRNANPDRTGRLTPALTRTCRDCPGRPGDALRTSRPVLGAMGFALRHGGTISLVEELITLYESGPPCQSDHVLGNPRTV
jgi:hypothetical protein